MTKRIETHRLTLRTLKHEDLVRFHNLINDPAVADTTFSIPNPMSYERAKTWMNYYVDPSLHGNDHHWGICLKNQEEIIGMINVYDIHPKWLQAEVGFWLGSEYWGNGYGTEATCTVVDYMMQHFPLQRLIASYQKTNIASAAILSKAGLNPLHTVRMYNKKKRRWEVVVQVSRERTER